MNENLINLIDVKAVVRLLVGLRLREAVKRHAKFFYWSISNNPKLKDPTVRVPVRDGDDEPSVESCVPGRRHWPRPPRRMRSSFSSEMAQRKALVGMMIRGLADENCQDPWKVNFLCLMEKLKARVGTSDLTFTSPLLRLKEKRTKEFRCLAQYTNTSDRVLLGLVARYLRDVFDIQMRPESYAFRRDGAISHTTAIQRLVEYRKKHGAETLYVAECDIQSFFDVLNHDVVMNAYDMFVEGSEEIIDPWFRTVVRAYLDSYSSFRSLMDSSSIEEEQKTKVSFVQSSLLQKDLRKMYGRVDFRNIGIGISQGGPLSPLLINMVMHRADEAVLSDNDDELFYARFCDDIIIVHPDKKKCQAALDRYLAVVQAMRLPYHKVKRSLCYKKEYYEAKSKGPTAWRDCKVGAMKSSPWVDFLGEQIRFDGQRRFRQKSVEKQKEKLLEEKATLLRAIGKNGIHLKPGLDKDDVFDTFRQRLVALGVGYAPQQLMGSKQDRCWAAAFPGIESNRWTRVQMRELDRVRDRILGSVGHGALSAKDKEAPVRRFFLGYPFSYMGFLTREARPSKYNLISGYEAYGV